MKSTPEGKEKAANDIRVSINSRARRVVQYAQKILEEKKFRELKFSAVGGSIGILLHIVEVMKITTPGLYQQNKITSVAYQTVDSNNEVTNQRLYPKLEVILSLDEFKTKTEGTQDKLDESIRKELDKLIKERREKKASRGARGRGFRGRGRGFRGRGRGFRGGRRGFRGRGMRPRGGFRGGRTGSRGRGVTRGRIVPRGRGAPRGDSASRRI